MSFLYRCWDVVALRDPHWVRLCEKFQDFPVADVFVDLNNLRAARLSRMLKTKRKKNHAVEKLTLCLYDMKSKPPKSLLRYISESTDLQELVLRGFNENNEDIDTILLAVMENKQRLKSLALQQYPCSHPRKFILLLSGTTILDSLCLDLRSIQDVPAMQGMVHGLLQNKTITKLTLMNVPMAFGTKADNDNFDAILGMGLEKLVHEHPRLRQINVTEWRAALPMMNAWLQFKDAPKPTHRAGLHMLRAMATILRRMQHVGFSRVQLHPTDMIVLHDLLLERSDPENDGGLNEGVKRLEQLNMGVLFLTTVCSLGQAQGALGGILSTGAFPHLNTLDFHGSALDNQAMCSLSNSLRGNNHLKVLKIGRQRYVTSEGYIALMEALPHSALSSLLDLKGFAALTALAQHFPSEARIREVSMSGESIRCDTDLTLILLYELLRRLENNFSLIRVSIDWNCWYDMLQVYVTQANALMEYYSRRNKYSKPVMPWCAEDEGKDNEESNCQTLNGIHMLPYVISHLLRHPSFVSFQPVAVDMSTLFTVLHFVSSQLSAV